MNIHGPHKNISQDPHTNNQMDDRQTSLNYTDTNPGRKGSGDMLVTLHDKTIKLQRFGSGHHCSHWDTNVCALQTKHFGMETSMKASTIHLMVADQNTKDAMNQLEQIYGENRINKSATKFPLGQRLLLAPLATKLNKKLGWPQLTS